MKSLGPTLPWPLGVAQKQDVLVGFDVNLQARVVGEEGTSVEKVPHQIALWASLESILLIDVGGQEEASTG